MTTVKRQRVACGFEWTDGVHGVLHVCIDTRPHKYHHCACYWQGGGIKR